MIVEEERRPLSAGFAANLAYFRLEFLDKQRVALKQAFREILPLLWLKSGAVGPRPELPLGVCEPEMFLPKGNRFAVLLHEACLGELLKAIKARSDLSHLFIVTDDDDAFKEMSAAVLDANGNVATDLQMVQLYRDYLENFMINRNLEV
jgi:adenine-specific DNA-methyltransferase